MKENRDIGKKLVVVMGARGGAWSVLEVEEGLVFKKDFLNVRQYYWQLTKMGSREQVERWSQGTRTIEKSKNRKGT